MEITVFYADTQTLCSTAADFWARFEDTLPAALRARHARYVRREDRELRTLGMWVLVRLLESFGYTGDVLRRLDYGPFGRPFFSGLKGFDFNLSHSGNYAVCAASTGGRVGIDIEVMRPLNLFEFEDVFAPETWNAILRAPDSQRAFFHCWTQLESIFKAEGSGLSGPLKELRLGACSALSREQPWFFQELKIDDEYACHVATDMSEFEVKSARVCPDPAYAGLDGDGSRSRLQGSWRV
jgi:4'-phosphopantetheinyl transferase